MAKTELEAAERSLVDAQHRLERLEARRENLATEHSHAVEERRKLLLDGDGENLKVLTAVDARVTAAESALAGVEDALVAARAKAVEITEQIADQRDQAARLGETATVKAAVEEIERVAQEFQAVSAKLVAAIGRIGERSPEMVGIGALVQRIAAEVPAATATAVADLQGYCRGLRAGTEGPRVRLTGLRPKPQTAPTPKPDGKPSGVLWQPPAHFKERHGGF